MSTLTLIVNPCPPIVIPDPPGLALNVSCPEFPSIISFTAIPFAFTISGPTSPHALSLNCLVAFPDYAQLCAALRDNKQLQITVTYDMINGSIVVRQVHPATRNDSLQSDLLREIRATDMDIQSTTRRLEHSINTGVMNDLALLKTQMVQVLSRLPPAVPHGVPNEPKTHPVSHFPNGSEDVSDEDLFASGKAS